MAQFQRKQQWTGIYKSTSEWALPRWCIFPACFLLAALAFVLFMDNRCWKEPLKKADEGPHCGGVKCGARGPGRWLCTHDWTHRMADDLDTLYFLALRNHFLYFSVLVFSFTSCTSNISICFFLTFLSELPSKAFPLMLLPETQIGFRYQSHLIVA